MASVSAFNQTLQEFLNELSEVFPEEVGIKTQKQKFKLDTVTDTNDALDFVMPILAKHADGISKREDDTIVLINEAFPEFSFTNLWKSDISDNTRKAIWDYLNTLLMLGTTIKTIPTNMLSEIEKIAQSCVSQMQENKTQPDQVFVEAQKAIFNNGMLQNMMSNMGGLDLSNLQQAASSAPTPVSTPRINHNKTKKKGKKK